ncbi:unnamed protein product [Closterium sp. NIES-54]
MENLMYKDWKAENEAKIGMRFGEVKSSGLEHVELPLELSSSSTTTRQSSLVNGGEEAKDAEEEEEEVQQLPEGRKTITSKWLFKIKSIDDGKIERYKSRLVAKGYQQKEKVDYKESFAPVVKPKTLRTLLAGAAIKGWVVKQMDVTTVFLNGILEEEIFMAQPEGFDDGIGRVWKLQKALYGLKQAPRQWYLKLREVLEEIGFTPSSTEHSLFMLGEGEQRNFMVVYVDDIPIFSPSSDLVKEVMLNLQDKFKCKALGDVSFYLGLHIELDVEKRCMRVHQRKYVEALATNFGQIEGHVATPFLSGQGSGDAAEKRNEPPPSKIEALDGSNYEEWSGRMRSAFKRYKLLKLATGEEKMPEEGDAHDRRIEKSAVLYDLILQSVNNDMFQHIKDLIKDTYARMAAAGSNVSQMQQCTKIISVLDNSWDNLIPTLNTQQDQWTPEWLRQQILQEDFRRRNTGGGAANKTAEGYGAAGGSKGRGGGRGRGRGRGFGRGRGRGDYNEGHGSSGGRGSTRMEGACCVSEKNFGGRSSQRRLNTMVRAPRTKFGIYRKKSDVWDGEGSRLGSPTSYISRFQQTKGKDFDEIFAPVGKGTTLRVMLGMAANRGWKIKQMDITTSFLNGIILEELYMLQPEGLDDGSGRVCRLKKAIYGLKQAPRAWYHKLEETLLAGGFKKSECDHSLFVLQEKEQFLMLLVYVDDILLFSESAEMIERVEEMLEMQFKKYCEGLAEKYGLQDGGKPAIPLPSSFTVEPCADEEVVGESDRKLFHSMVGALNYAANHTRPDIAFATSRLASLVSRPSHEQLEAAKRLVRYVSATASVGLEYSAVRQRLQRGAADLSKGEMLLTCYTDASFNSVKADGTSIGGYVCLFGGGAVS